MKNTQVILVCKLCNKEFKVRAYRKDTAHYCSQDCARTDPQRRLRASERLKANPIPNSDKTCYQKGHAHSLETKMKMRKPKAIKRPKQPRVSIQCRYCDLFFETKPYYESTAKFCSYKCYNLHIDRGLTSEQRKIRSSEAYKTWRTTVFERDNYTCVLCGTRGGKLNADHIKRFADHPELRLDVDNGRTLCEECHRQTPTYGNRSAA